MPRGKQKQEPILHTCSECEYMYYPDKDYVNYRLYLDVNHELFMCKCEKSKHAHFLNEKQCKEFRLRKS